MDYFVIIIKSIVKITSKIKKRLNKMQWSRYFQKRILSEYFLLMEPRLRNFVLYIIIFEIILELTVTGIVEDGPSLFEVSISDWLSKWTTRRYSRTQNGSEPPRNVSSLCVCISASGTQRQRMNYLRISSQLRQAFSTKH